MLIKLANSFERLHFLPKILLSENFGIKSASDVKLLQKNMLNDNVVVAKLRDKNAAVINYGDRDYRGVTGYIRAVYTEPEFRGNHLAERLIKVACKHMGKPTWMQVKKGNASMESLISRIGFRPVEDFDEMRVWQIGHI